MIKCRVGELRHRITFRSATRATDAAGQKVLSSYSDVAKVWSRVKSLQAREAKRGQQIESQATHVVTIRYMDGLDSTMSIKFGSRRFNITGIVDVDELNVQLDVYCTEVTAAGILTARVESVNLSDGALIIAFANGAQIDPQSLPPISAVQATDGAGTIIANSIELSGRNLIVGFARDVTDPATWQITDSTVFAFLPPARLTAPLSGNVFAH